VRKSHQVYGWHECNEAHYGIETAECGESGEPLRFDENGELDPSHPDHPGGGGVICGKDGRWFKNFRCAKRALKAHIDEQLAMYKRMKQDVHKIRSKDVV